MGVLAWFIVVAGAYSGGVFLVFCLLTGCVVVGHQEKHDGAGQSDFDD